MIVNILAQAAELPRRAMFERSGRRILGDFVRWPVPGDASLNAEHGSHRPDLREGTLLVLDDDALSLDLMSQVTATAMPGFTICTQSDVAEAIALCETRPIDCLMIDYDMPSVDGLTAAKYLRQRHPEMPIILVTGVGDGVLAVEAMHAGVNGYIPKHRISVDLLRRTVTSAMALAQAAARAAGTSDKPPFFRPN